MKVVKWKVLSIAGALVLGYAVASNAAHIKVDEDTFADVGYWMKVRYMNIDERAKNDVIGEGVHWDSNVFYPPDARIHVEGQINKYVQFYGELATEENPEVLNGDVSNGAASIGSGYEETGVRLEEGGINLVFIPEFQIRVAKGRIPFTREQQVEHYSYIVPTGPWYDTDNVLRYGIYDASGRVLVVSGASSGANSGFAGPLSLLRDINSGVVVHGEFLNGMFRYDLGIFNEDNRYGKAFESVAYTARLEFTPTMMGFSPETKTTAHGWLYDSYLGKKGDVLTIGIGYYNQDLIDEDEFTFGTISNPDLETDAYTIDFFLEKKFVNSVLNLEAAYTYMDDNVIYAKYSTGGGVSELKTGDTYYWYIQGQLLYDVPVGVGKPAIFARYERVEADGEYCPALGRIEKDWSYYRWGAGINYYIEGNAARISVGFDNINYDDAASEYLDDLNVEDNPTDYYVQLQVMF